MHAVRRLTPGMYRRRSAFENHPAAAAFGGGGQAWSNCNRLVFSLIAIANNTLIYKRENLQIALKNAHNQMHFYHLKITIYHFYESLSNFATKFVMVSDI